MTTDTPVSILVVAHDAELRDYLFKEVAALGYRVDAVADGYHAGRRLFKDEYDAVVAQKDGIDSSLADSETPVIEVAPTPAPTRDHLAAELKQALG